jgi:hypothetical protein
MLMKKLLSVAVVLLGLCVVASAENLLKNPGFEDELGPDNWAPAWGTFSRETWNTPPEGAYAAYLRGTWCGAGDGGGVIQSVPALPGTVYSVSASFYLDNGFTAASQVLKLEFFDDAGKVLEAFTNTLTGLADSKWTEKSISAESPAGAKKVQVVFEATGVGGEGTIGADNFVLEEKK